MEERFQDAEIRVAQFRPFDALGCVWAQRLYHHACYQCYRIWLRDQSGQ